MFNDVNKDIEIFNKIKIKNKEMENIQNQQRHAYIILMMIVIVASILGTILYTNFSLKGFMFSVLMALCLSLIFFITKIIIVKRLNQQYDDYIKKYSKNISFVNNENYYISNQNLKEYLDYEKSLSKNGKYMLSHRNIYVHKEELIFHLIMKEIIDTDSEFLLENLESNVDIIKFKLKKLGTHDHVIKMILDKILNNLEDEVIYENIDKIIEVIKNNFNKNIIEKYKQKLSEITLMYDENLINEKMEDKKRTEEELLEEKFKKLQEEEEYQW